MIKVAKGLAAGVLLLSAGFLVRIVFFAPKQPETVVENRQMPTVTPSAAPEATPEATPIVTPEPIEEEPEELLVTHELPGVTPRIKEAVEKKLSEMTLEEKAAQLFFITPDALVETTGVRAAGERTKKAFTKYPVGGLIFFDENIKDPGQMQSITEGLTRFSEERLGVIPFLGVDEEGGSVVHLANKSPFMQQNIGNMSEIAKTQNPEKAYQAGSTIGGYMAQSGLNLDFAPVADLLINPDNAIAKERSFGADAQLNAQMTAKAVEGFLAEGISPVLKHFPGHGATDQDSHNGTAVSMRTIEELRKEELLPFQAGIEAGAQFVMAGHISLPNVNQEDVPASLSRYFLQEILRKELGFTGIIITDAMNMKAITDYYSSGGGAVKAIQAGADMILMPENFSTAYQAILDAVNRGAISMERLDESVGRILTVKYIKKATFLEETP